MASQAPPWKLTHDGWAMYKTILAAALMFAATAVAPANPSGAIALLPGAVGDDVHVRVTRTDQELNAPRVAAEDFDIQLKPNNVLLLTRTIAGKPDFSIVRIGADGSLQIDASEKGAGSDADLTSVLAALNLALATIHDAGSAQPSWKATLAIPSLARGPATNVVVPIAGIGTSNANVYEVQGSAQVAATPPRGNADDDNGGGGRFGGGGMGGGMPGGGGFPGGGQRPSGGGRAPAAGDQARAMTLLVNVDGQVSAGRLRRIVISQTRVLTVDGVPFTNVTSWTVETPG
jgi:uncharacterized membrane protein YgcG